MNACNAAVEEPCEAAHAAHLLLLPLPPRGTGCRSDWRQAGGRGACERLASQQRPAQQLCCSRRHSEWPRPAAARAPPVQGTHNTARSVRSSLGRRWAVESTRTPPRALDRQSKAPMCPPGRHLARPPALRRRRPPHCARPPADVPTLLPRPAAAHASPEMRAAVLPRFGPPSVVRVEQGWPTPVRQRGQVLVQVHCSSVNPIDCKTRAGIWTRFLCPLPMVSGALGGTGCSIFMTHLTAQLQLSAAQQSLTSLPPARPSAAVPAQPHRPTPFPPHACRCRGGTLREWC